MNIYIDDFLNKRIAVKVNKHSEESIDLAKETLYPLVRDLRCPGDVSFERYISNTSSGPCHFVDGGRTCFNGAEEEYCEKRNMKVITIEKFFELVNGYGIREFDYVDFCSLIGV